MMSLIYFHNSAMLSFSRVLPDDNESYFISMRCIIKLMNNKKKGYQILEKQTIMMLSFITAQYSELLNRGLKFGVLL